MIVGGNEDERGLLVKTFSELEITTVGTSGADTALAEFYDTPYDCVVLDTTLAPTTCTELAKLIRRTRQQTKVIWWVDESEPDRQVRFVNSPEGALSTPCSGEEIQRILQQLS